MYTLERSSEDDILKLYLVAEEVFLKAPHLSRKYMNSVSKVIRSLDYLVNIVLIWVSADYVSLVAILKLSVAVLLVASFFYLWKRHVSIENKSMLNSGIPVYISPS